jgi:hypothetical protein
MSAVVPFPGQRLRRFVAVQFIAPDSWRAAIFVGWNVDPNAPQDGNVTTHWEALARAKRIAHNLGLPLIADRCRVPGGKVLTAPQ